MENNLANLIQLLSWTGNFEGDFFSKTAAVIKSQKMKTFMI